MSAATAADRRLHPSTLFTGFIRRVPEFVLGLPALIGFASQAGWGRILTIAAIGAVFSLGTSLAAWLRFRYGVGEREIVIESGILNRQRRIIPFDRVQDIDIEQPLLARLFGTARVRIETGGGGKDEGNLDTISLGEAQRIRDLIRGRASFTPEAADGEAEEPLLFQMPFPRLLVAGLFNFSLVFLAILGGALQYLQPLIERTIGNPKDWIAPTAERAAGMGLYLTIAFIALLLVLGVVTGIARTIARDYGFRLTRAPAGFRRRRGLFTLSEAVIPLRRVQLALLTSGWLRRRLGWFGLEFQTLSADAQQSGHQQAAPFARVGEIMPILAEAGFERLPADEDYVRVSRRSILRRMLDWVLPTALVLAAIAIFRPLALLLLIPLAILPLLLVLEWRRHRYVLTPRAIFIAEGLIAPRLWMLPYENAQSFSVTRSALQRRLGLASLAIDTAGASVFRAPVIRDLEAADADALAERLLAAFHGKRLERRSASPIEVVDAVDQRPAEPALDEQCDRDAAKQPDHQPAVDHGGAAPGPDGDPGADQPERSPQPPVP